MLSHNSISAHQDPPSPPPSADSPMRATFKSASTTPTTPARELDSATPRPDKMQDHDVPTRRSSPVIYESRAQPQRRPPEAPESQQSLAHAEIVHDIFPLAPRSRNALFDDDNALRQSDLFQHLGLHPSSSRDFVLSAPSTGNEPHLSPLTMSEQRSNAPDRPSSRGRSYSNASRRGGPSARQNPAQAFQAHYPLLPDPSTSQPSYHGQYPSTSGPYAQRGPYGSGQYTMSPPPPPVSMVSQQSAPPYSYASHPSLVSPDNSMQPQNQLLQGYSANTLMPHMQPHTPVYTYPAHSPEAAPSPNQPYANSPTATPGLYPSSPSSHTLLTSPGTSQPLGSPYTTPSPYGAQYPSPSFVYSPHPYAHSGNTVYQSQYSYGQQYRTPDQERGTWWYLPPGTRPAPSPHYPAYDNTYASVHPLYPSMASHDAESYSPMPQAGPSSMSSPFHPMSPQHQPPFPVSAPSQPHLQQPPGPDPPPPLAASSSRSLSDARSDDPSSPVTMNRADRPHLRKPYHPNPPTNRSEWVMWAGNVPSDATHDELWRFFNSSPSPSSSSSSLRSRTNAGEPAAFGSIYGGVSSIHLISRSNCAFVNFESEAHLHAAISHFNGHQLRPNDPRCPRLVCRIRAREDDLKAGVGGQRGAGIHVRHVKDLRQKQKEARARSATSPETSSSEAPLSSPEDPSQMMGALSLSGDEEGAHARRFRKPAPHSSSSGSYASTNSSLLTQYFPKRYFILKSLGQFDLDLSVEKGLWATQRHNEGILDQAYRTSKEVYLIFGVNKSGEFYGYAKMAGPVLHHHGEQKGDRVSWASRSSADSSSRRTSTSTRESSSPRASRIPQYLSPSDGARFEESPLPIETPEAPVRPQHPHGSHTAPPVMHHHHRPLSSQSAGVPHHGEFSYQERDIASAVPSIIAQRRQDDFQLDPQAPTRVAKQRSADATFDEDGVKHWDAAGSDRFLSAVEEEEESSRSPSTYPDTKGKAPEHTADADAKKDPVWGDSFQVEWIRTDRLPFYRTRHLRNAWNHDREVKVSRDGTELEPSVGQALLDEWDKPDPQSPPSPQRSGTKSVPPGATTSPPL